MKTYALLLSSILFTACGSEAKDAIDDGGSGTETESDTGAVPTGFVDADGDGATTAADCDDSNPFIHPGADELCNEIDDDCDGVIDEDPIDGSAFFKDGDGDGYGHEALEVVACSVPDGFVDEASDCDDERADINPGATEDDCTDPVDYNCDGSVGYADLDGDGTPACDDCDDTNPAVNPHAAEVCNDGVDDDCDGEGDESGAVGEQTWFADADGDLHGDPTVRAIACTAPEGYVATATDCNDASSDANPSGIEICDGLDNDCDGIVDGPEPIGGTVLYADGDGDGYGASSVELTVCTPIAGFVAASGDCDDTDATAYPGATESCDEVDNDCDGDVDEALTSAYYADPDGDGYGLSLVSIDACEAPVGYVAMSGDCDETEPSAYPGGVEVCDGIDNDCNGEVDDGLMETLYPDLDGDGYGLSAMAIEACDSPAGYSLTSGDCDDGEPAAFPGGTETCDGIDNDCNGEADDGLMETLYPDLDGDGYGLTAMPIEACDSPAGYSLTSGDCDDGEPAAFPGGIETCDGIDNDCSGEVDEGLGLTYYTDLDSDGFGDSDSVTVACAYPEGHALIGGDCDPLDADIHPMATEICDGIDNDCDELTDDADSDIDFSGSTTWYADADGDGYGDPLTPLDSCVSADGFIEDDSDCDDDDSETYPGAVEVWYDGVDQDCDGASDFDADGDGHDSVDSGGDDTDDMDPDCWDDCLPSYTEDDPGYNCQTIAEDHPGLDNDWYWIAPEGSPMEVYCDIENGGWMMCFELVNTSGTDLGTENVWLNDCIDQSLASWTGNDLRVMLEDNYGSVLYDETGSRDHAWSYDHITSTTSSSNQYDSSRHERLVSLSNGDKLMMAGQNASNSGCGGSFGNGYSVVIYPSSPGYHSNVKMLVVPDSQPFGGGRGFSGWSSSHEISYQPGTMDTCSYTYQQLGTFTFWLR